MAIHVRTDYYMLNSPEEFDKKCCDLVYVAALAKRLNLEDVYNQAKKMFDDIHNKWDKEGLDIARKNGSTNWLGAGTIYIPQPMLPWNISFGLAEAVVDEIPVEECRTELKQALSKL